MSSDPHTCLFISSKLSATYHFQYPFQSPFTCCMYIPPTYMYSQRSENGGVSLSQYRGASLVPWMSTPPF